MIDNLAFPLLPKSDMNLSCPLLRNFEVPRPTFLGNELIQNIC